MIYLPRELITPQSTVYKQDPQRVQGVPKQPVAKKGEPISSEPRHDIKKEKSLQATPSLKASDSKKKISGAGQSSSRSVDQRTQPNRGHSRSPTKSTKPGTNPRTDDCDSKAKKSDHQPSRSHSRSRSPSKSTRHGAKPKTDKRDDKVRKSEHQSSRSRPRSYSRSPSKSTGHGARPKQTVVTVK